MNEIKIPTTIINWILYMLSNRQITLKLQGASLTRKIYKGCPQGGILSPFLWNITLNILLANKELHKDFLQAFADDMAIIIPGIDPSTLCDIASKYLSIIDKWCLDNGVKLSELKTKIVLFRTKNRKFTLKPITVRGKILEINKEARFLGVTLDSYLNWSKHIEQ